MNKKKSTSKHPDWVSLVMKVLEFLICLFKKGKESSDNNQKQQPSLYLSLLPYYHPGNPLRQCSMWRLYGNNA